jgi:hypothetical protein
MLFNIYENLMISFTQHHAANRDSDRVTIETQSDNYVIQQNKIHILHILYIDISCFLKYYEVNCIL